MPIKYLSYQKEDSIRLEAYNAFFEGNKNLYEDNPTEYQRQAFEKSRREIQKKAYPQDPPEKARFTYSKNGKLQEPDILFV